MAGQAGAVAARIEAVGTANPKSIYTQRDILARYKVDDEKIRSVFLNSHIDQRHLTLPALDDNDEPLPETQGQLLEKHRVEGVELAGQALRNCLDRAGTEVDDIGYLCCVTS